MSQPGPRLRVAVDATSLLDVRTGVGTFVAELLCRLAAQESLDVVAYGLTRVYASELRRRLPAGISTPRWPLPQRTLLAAWQRADLPPVEWWTGAVAVVHGTNFVVPPGRGAVELVTIHDLTTVRFPELCDEYTVRYPGLIRRALARGAHVHVVSQFVADEVADVFAVARDRIHVVHNGVTPALGGDAERGRALARWRRYVLAVGTIEPRKNLAALVQAFDGVAATSSDLGLVIAGRPGWRTDSFEAAMATAVHRDRIVRLGWVSDEQRADLLAGAAVLAYPSVYEGFGLPPLEAMTAGVPVVATTAGALVEVLGDAAVLVAPEADALAGAIAGLLADDERRADLVRRGHARAAGFSWDRCASEIATLYRYLAGAGDP